MSDNHETNTRKDRYEKKRTNTKLLTWLSVIGGVLVIVMLSVIFIGRESDTTAGNEENQAEEFALGSSNQEADEPDSQEKKDLEVNEVEGEEEEEEGQNDTEEVESDDSNVKKAYKSNWEAIGTSQEEPHTTSFDKGSTDWQEMKQAVEVATGIPSEEQVEHWFGGAGEQAAEATVAPKSNQDEIYRVHLEWVEDQGWKPVLVEELNEVERR